jgi:N-acyl-D-aspartate/D-glutamate deacylase
VIATAIRDASVADGGGAEPYFADVGIDDEGRIAAIGDVGAATTDVDGEGRVLAPGFVDVHTHDDGALLAHPGLAFKLSQGCTSLVIGNCGFSAAPAQPGRQGRDLLGLRPDWSDLDGFAAAVESRHPACNAIALVGHNTVRHHVMGMDDRTPSAAELEEMRGHVARAMAQGACGFSSGLVYQPGRYSRTDELIALAAEAAPHGGIYATHMRNEGDRLLEAVDEALAISRQAGVPLQISHHKAAGRRNWGRVPESLAHVDEARAAGHDVTLDVYPYTAGSGPMIQYFDLDDPDPELAESIRLASCPAFPEFEGRMLVDVAAELGIGVTEAVRHVLTAPLGERTICIQFVMDEADVVANLGHPAVMVGSDGIPDLAGRPHPRLYGTFPRVLGRYVREQGVLTLAEAVRRMTSLACDRFGLTDRGHIAVGAWADLVLFNAATVADTATYDDPQREATGIDAVWVNGCLAFDHGRHTGAGAGRLLRYRQA